MQKILSLALMVLMLTLKNVLYADGASTQSNDYKIHPASLLYHLYEPILYISIQNEIVFRNELAPAKLSIDNVEDNDRILTYSNILGYGEPLPGYQFSGFLANDPATINVQLKTSIGELNFTGNLHELLYHAFHYSYLEANGPNGKKYQLKISAFRRHHVLVKLKATDLLPTLIPCHYIDIKEQVTEVDSPSYNQASIKQKPNPKMKDDLFYEIHTKDYVIVAGDIGPGGKGLNLDGKIITLALSPEGKNEPIIHPEYASEIESRIGGPYAKGFKALGFARDRDLIVLVDGKVTGRHSNFNGGHRFDLIINGKKEKFFLFVRHINVLFKTGLLYDETVYAPMYVINMYRIDVPV